MTNPNLPPVVVLNDNEENLYAPRRPRSPHPYTYSDCSRYEPGNNSSACDQVTNTPSTNNGSVKVSSESGTEADDESGSLFKGLPAPPARPRKGLRGGGSKDEALSPLVTPRSLQEGKRSLSLDGRRDNNQHQAESDARERTLREKYSRRKRGEILRRATEVGLLSIVAVLICSEPEAWKVLKEWRQELLYHVLLAMALYVYALSQGLHLFCGRFSQISLASLASFHYPSSFDPAPYMYPVVLPLLISVSLANCQPSLILANCVLGLCSLLQATGFHTLSETATEPGNWLMAVIPIAISEWFSENHLTARPLALKLYDPKVIDREDLVLLFLLHEALIETLRFITTTSLDPAELQLLSSALTNLLLFSTSPQMLILKAILWVGGLTLFIFCRCVLNWELALARVPTWRFRNLKKKSTATLKTSILTAAINKLGRPLLAQPDESSESEGALHEGRVRSQSRPTEVPLNLLNDSAATASGTQSQDFEFYSQKSIFSMNAMHIDGIPLNHRRRALSSAENNHTSNWTSKRTTPSGRPKRSINPSSRSFLSLTAKEARIRRAAYATYIFAAIACDVLIPIRLYVAKNALSGRDPFGWFIGYLLGQIGSFRLWVVKENFGHWILLPPGSMSEGSSFQDGGWLNSLRLHTVGAATTRLIIIGYWIMLLAIGLGIVSKLSSIVEVDTRRKVFHGLIVAMILPVSFVDPCFTALALALVLAAFLLLDLLRASQVPPVARPLTNFLAPYVDGRDHRGPVIVSHIFLLVGCSIPYWLSLAGSERGGDDPWQGWESLTRDISMVSGVICVGMGDAAASLIGRRYGRHKWFWGGGKSIEGSLAFIAAVAVGLVCAKFWLRLGGWKQSEENPLSMSKIVLAASGASLTEAVLTGANDNVVVPLILWLLVRGLRI